MADQVGQVDAAARRRGLDFDHEATQGDVIDIGIQRQKDALASGKDHLSIGGLDDAALVVDGGAKQQDRTARIGRQLRHRIAGRAATAQHDGARLRAIGARRQGVAVGVMAAGKGRCAETTACQHTGQKALVGDVQGRCHQRLDIDLSAAVKQDAVLIDQQHLSVGRQLALDDAGVRVMNAIQRGGRRVGLHELHLARAADVEGLPIDDGALGGLIDGQARARSAGGSCADHGLAADHTAKLRQSGRWQGWCRSRGGRVQQHAEGSQHGQAAARSGSVCASTTVSRQFRSHTHEWRCHERRQATKGSAIEKSQRPGGSLARQSRTEVTDSPATSENHLKNWPCQTGSC